MQQHALLDGVPERRDQDGRGRSGDLLEQIVADHPPGNRRHTHDPLRHLVECREARGQHLAKRRG